MDYDNQVMDELIAIREQIAQDKADLETARQEQQAAKDEQEAAKASLKTQKSEVDALIDQISSQQAEVEKEMCIRDRSGVAQQRRGGHADRQLSPWQSGGKNKHSAFSFHIQHLGAVYVPKGRNIHGWGVLLWERMGFD